MCSQSNSKYEDLKEQVEIFLANETAQGMLIYGDWGIGKTYFINEIVNEYQMLTNAKLDFYSYASLYSINGIEDFKNEIINNKKITQKGFFKICWLKICHLWQNIKITFSQFGVSMTWMLKTNISKKLKKTLIVVDDLERKGKSIDIIEALGTLNGMTIANGSKFIVLANINELESEKDKQYLQKNKDKLFSSLISFQENIHLSIEICNQLASRNNGFEAYSECFNEIAKVTNITNVRVLYSILTSFCLFKSGLDNEIKGKSINNILIKELNDFFFIICYLFESGVFIYHIKPESKSVVDFIEKMPSLITLSECDDDSKLKGICQKISMIIDRVKEANILMSPSIIMGILDFLMQKSNRNQIIKQILTCFCELNDKVSDNAVSETIRNIHDGFKELSSEDINIIKEIPSCGKISLRDYIFVLPYQNEIINNKKLVNDKFIAYFNEMDKFKGVNSEPMLKYVDITSENYSFLRKECRDIINKIKENLYLLDDKQSYEIKDIDFKIMYDELISIKETVNKASEGDCSYNHTYELERLRRLFNRCKLASEEQAIAFIFKDSTLVTNIIYTNEFRALKQCGEEYKEFENLYQEINSYLMFLIEKKIKLQPYQSVRLNQIKDKLKN